MNHKDNEVNKNENLHPNITISKNPTNIDLTKTFFEDQNSNVIYDTSENLFFSAACIEWQTTHTKQKILPQLELDICRYIISNRTQENLHLPPNFKFTYKSQIPFIYAKLIKIFMQYDSDLEEYYSFALENAECFSSAKISLIDLLKKMQAKGRSRNDHRYQLLKQILHKTFENPRNDEFSPLTEKVFTDSLMQLVDLNEAEYLKFGINDIKDALSSPIQLSNRLANVYLKIISLAIQSGLYDIETLKNYEDTIRKIQQNNTTAPQIQNNANVNNQQKFSQSFFPVMSEADQIKKYRECLLSTLHHLAFTTPSLLHDILNQQIEKIDGRIENDPTKEICSNIILLMLKSGYLLNNINVPSTVNNFIAKSGYSIFETLFINIFKQIGAEKFCNFIIKIIDYLNAIIIPQICEPDASMHYLISESHESEGYKNLCVLIKKFIPLFSDKQLEALMSALEPLASKFNSKQYNPQDLLDLMIQIAVKIKKLPDANKYLIFITKIAKLCNDSLLSSVLNLNSVECKPLAELPSSTPIPYLLKVLLDKDLQLYSKFYHAYQSANNVNQLVDFNLFIFANLNKIINLHYLLGDYCFTFLTTLTAQSTEPLLRFFSGYSLIRQTDLAKTKAICTKLIAENNIFLLERVLIKISEARLRKRMYKDEPLDKIFHKSYDKFVGGEISVTDFINNLDEALNLHYLSCMLPYGQELSETHIKTHHQFYKSFIAANNNASPLHYITYIEFVRNYWKNLRSIFLLLGENAFVFLKACIAPSALTLTRFLDSYHDFQPELAVPIGLIFSHCEKHPSQQLSQTQKISFIKIASEISRFCANFTYGHDHVYQDQKIDKVFSDLSVEFVSNKIKFDELLRQLKLMLNTLYCNELDIPYTENILDRLITLFPNEQFTQLFEGRRHMKQNENMLLIFDTLLKVDLLNLTSFNDLILNERQELEFGQQLAAHNCKALQYLQNSGLNIELIKKYDRYIEYNDTSLATSSINSSLYALWRDTAYLQEKLTALIKKLNEEFLITQTSIFEDLFNQIDMFRKQVMKANKNQDLKENDIKALGQITKEAQINHLQKIKNKIGKIKEHLTNSKSELSNQHEDLKRGVIEYGDHLIQRIETITQYQTTKTDSKPLKLKEGKQFRIQMWDKSRHDTLFLGNAVNCCLATDGAYHYAIHQRRIDIAMQIPVVIDLKTQKPIALIWGYFAYDKDNSKKIIFVANFIEMIANIANQEALRRSILDQLLKFTAQYAADVGAHEFIIQHLQYGVIPDGDLKNLESISVNLEKVGGFFNYDSDPDDEPQSYYLNSLASDTFHRYPLAKLSNNNNTSGKAEIVVDNISKQQSQETSFKFFTQTKKSDMADTNDTVSNETGIAPN